MSERPENFEVARLFEEIARSLDVKGEQGHRPRAYRRAARGVAGYPEPLSVLSAEGRLRDVPGIGPSLEALISEYLRTGAMGTHLRLVTDFPPGLAPLLAARGFGPAGVQSLVEKLGVTDLDSVERAAQEGRLAEAIGPKRAADLVAQLPALRNPIRVMRLKPAWEVALETVALLDDPSLRPRKIEIAGQARRMCDMVDGGLDFVALVDSDEHGQRLLERVGMLPSDRRGGRTPRGTACACARTTASKYVCTRRSRRALARRCCGTPVRRRTWPDCPRSPKHDSCGSTGRGYSRPMAVSSSARAKQTSMTRSTCPFIAPELREDDGEIEAALAGDLPQPGQPRRPAGDLHCHTPGPMARPPSTTWPAAARDHGYEYMALTDHSRSLTITNGLSLERLEEARRQVDQLNHELAPFVVLLGTEMDILAGRHARLPGRRPGLARLRLGLGAQPLQADRRADDAAHLARGEPSAGAHAESSARSPARHSRRPTRSTCSA